MKRRVAIVVLLIAGLLSSAACANATSTEPAARHEVGMRDIAYQPANLKLRAGQPVSLMLLNEGSLVHDFTIQEMPRDGLKTSGGLRSGWTRTCGRGAGGAPRA